MNKRKYKISIVFIITTIFIMSFVIPNIISTADSSNIGNNSNSSNDNDIYNVADNSITNDDIKTSNIYNSAVNKTAQKNKHNEIKKSEDNNEANAVDEKQINNLNPNTGRNKDKEHSNNINDNNKVKEETNKNNTTKSKNDNLSKNNNSNNNNNNNKDTHKDQNVNKNDNNKHHKNNDTNKVKNKENKGKVKQDNKENIVKKEKSDSVSNEKKKEESYNEESITGDYMSLVSLNIRKGPSTKYDSIGTLTPLTKVEAIAKAKVNGKVWLKIKDTNNKIGWSSEAYLEKYDHDKISKIKKEQEEIAKKKKEANKSKYGSMTFTFNGKTLKYKNGGKENGSNIIDAGKYISTWGGAAIFSGTDGKSTHFIGHNPGLFAGVQNASSFIVTDKAGNVFKYEKTYKYLVDQYGVRKDNGKENYNRIANGVNEEIIIIQTCKPGTDYNYIIEAKLVN